MTTFHASVKFIGLPATTIIIFGEEKKNTYFLKYQRISILCSTCTETEFNEIRLSHAAPNNGGYKHRQTSKKQTNFRSRPFSGRRCYNEVC